MTTARPPKVDPTDIAIIVKLSQDPKATNAAIAKELRVSEETVRRRLKRLISRKLVGFTIHIDPRVFGFTENAVLTLKPTPNADTEVLTFASKLQAVTRAYRVLESDGVNIVAEASCYDVAELIQLFELLEGNQYINIVSMQRIFDPEYRALGYPGMR